MGREDRRTRMTKLLIRRAFSGLLMQKPFESISVRELCERADINRGTFYKHYSDIYALMKSVEEEVKQVFYENLQPLVSSQTRVPPIVITTKIFEFLKENPDACALALSPYGQKRLAMELLDIGKEHYLNYYSKFVGNIDYVKLDYYYAFVSAGYMGILEKWFDAGMREDAGFIANMAQNIMLKGMEFITLD